MSLSPHLFLIVMTAMLEDAHSRTNGRLKRYRPPGAAFDEGIYSDNTVCFSTDTGTTSEFTQEIDEEKKQNKQT